MASAAPAAALRLTRLRIKNFRSVGEVDVPLGPLTVLVGPNGAGKSNVVDALRFLRDCLTRGLDQAILDREGMTVLRRWSANGRSLDVSVGVTLADDDGSTVAYDFTLASLPQQGFVVKQEQLHVAVANEAPVTVARLLREGLLITRQDEKHWVKPTAGNGLRAAARLLGATELVMRADDFLEDDLSGSFFSLVFSISQVLRSSLFYLLNPVQLRAPQRVVKEAPFEETGENLSAVLRQLRRSKETADEVRQTMARLVGGIVDFSISSAGSYLVTYLHYKNAAGKIRKADLGQESDGTLRALAILTALYQQINSSPEWFSDKPHQLLTIEEPEVNIHPGMLAVLAEAFREASLRHQILLTTHSPDLLDFLPAESFLVVEKTDEETQVGPLAADQVEIIRQRLFTPGELLRSEGLHRQPAPTPAA